jgi:protein-S-isoprenylcysteine O-methyltransferase Ste14
MQSGTDIRELLFKYRSYTPIPFLIVMVVFARPTSMSLIAGVVLLLLGEAIRFWGVSIAGSETRYTGAFGGSSLVTTGPFAYVRNPLYVGNILMYMGVGIMSMALFPWLVVAALCWFCIQYYLIVTREEEHLAKSFGAEYDEYRKHVRRFLPSFSSYRNATPSQKAVDFKRGVQSEQRTFQAIVLVTLMILVIYLLQRSQG